MHIFSYKMDHDFGLAPNPFWGVMTLAVCKGKIRRNKNLHIGDWVVGTGSKKLKMINHLIYAMRVDEIITFDAYWKDSRFECKKPVFKGSLAQIYGDNFYHTDESTGRVIQEQSAHQYEDDRTNPTHLQRDSDGKNVLVSRHFYYFGNEAPVLPPELVNIACQSRDYHYQDIDEDLQHAFVDWISKNYAPGIYGDPINWKVYQRPDINVPQGL